MLSAASVLVYAREVRMHFWCYGIAAEKVDQCIVVLHGLRVASLDREGSYGHLNASSDCHTANLVMAPIWPACSAGVVQLHWDDHTAGSTWQGW
jgi:hypothetical protein